MTRLNVGIATVQIEAGEKPYHGSPISDRGGGSRDGVVRLAKITTPDGLVATIGVTRWKDADSDLRLIDFLSGPDSYRRLERAGNMSLNMVPAGVVGVLRALKYAGREYPTLSTVDWAQLDEWLGQDAQAFLRNLGALQIGEHGALRPAAKRFQDAPAVIVDPSLPDALFAAYALTRVIPLAVDFGRDGVEALH